MKSLLLSMALLIAATLPAAAEKAWVALAPIPYGLVLPDEIAAHISTGPLAGVWADQVKAMGARSSVLAYYQPEKGDKVILFSAYYFDADKWDAAQKPDEPPPFGQPVLRADGRVLSVAGPQDTIFDPDTEDGRNVVRATLLLREPANFQPVE